MKRFYSQCAGFVDLPSRAPFYTELYINQMPQLCVWIGLLHTEWENLFWDNRILFSWEQHKILLKGIDSDSWCCHKASKHFCYCNTWEVIFFLLLHFWWREAKWEARNVISLQLQHGRAPAGDSGALAPHGVCSKCSSLLLFHCLCCVWEPSECDFCSISNKRPCIDSAGSYSALFQ